MNNYKKHPSKLNRGLQNCHCVGDTKYLGALRAKKKVIIMFGYFK